ncbi:UNVERIFIED_CONTAM: hypothetical protein Cloal_3678 [Acetivibrio alkalicellulosi]
MILQKIKGLFIEEEGQGLVEYGVVVGVVAALAIVAAVIFRAELTAVWTATADGVHEGHEFIEDTVEAVMDAEYDDIWSDDGLLGRTCDGSEAAFEFFTRD